MRLFKENPITHTVKRNSVAGRLALDEILRWFSQNGLINNLEAEAISDLDKTNPFEAAQQLVVHMKSNEQEVGESKIMNNSRVSAYNTEKKAV
jgi:hypothetical protein